MKEILIKEGTGIAFKVNKGEIIKVMDVEGQQVADLFAVNFKNHLEFFSASVTLDCKESIKITTGDFLVSNLYKPMLKIINDTVGTHDILLPCCRKETYDFFYKNGLGHRNCFDNINNGLSSFGVNPLNEIRPFNIFMNTSVNKFGDLIIGHPVSKAGDYLILQAEMELVVCVSACPLTEGNCNAGKSKPLKIMIEKT